MNNPDNGKTALRALALLGGILLSTNAATAAVEISALPTSNMACTGGVCSPTAKKAVLNVGDLEAMLASGDVRVTSGAQAQDIEIDKTLRWSSIQTLTFDAYRSIFFNRPVFVTGSGSLMIETNDGGSGGDYRFFGKGHVEFRNIKPGQSELVINGKGYELVSTMKHLLRDVRRDTHIALASSFSAASAGVFVASPIADWEADTIEGLGNTVSALSIDSGTRTEHRFHADGLGTNGLGFIGTLGSNSTVRDIGLIRVSVSSNAQEQLVGGLVGMNEGTIKYSYVTGNVSANGWHAYVGGLVGGNKATTLGSYSTATVSGADTAFGAGGLVGGNAGTCDGGVCFGLVDQCYAAGVVSGGNSIMTGGLVGENLGGAITNSYATGAVGATTNAFAGGLVGGNVDNAQDHGHPSVQTSYATGTVTGGSDTTAGGFIGEDTAPTAIANSYWDLNTSGISDPSRGAGNIANDSGITGLTDVQLKSALPVGFDRKVWAQRAGMNNGLPYLLANPPPA